jgi:hypothetical protein
LALELFGAKESESKSERLNLTIQERNKNRILYVVAMIRKDTAVKLCAMLPTNLFIPLYNKMN